MTQILNLSTATTEQMRALQLKELEILKYLKKICEQNNLEFFLAGGSAIGALRHGGFVPWDDDVDVFMLRSDYEKLYKNWNIYSDHSSQYELCRSDATHNYRHAAMTLNDNKTTFINYRTIDEDVNQGIAVDIIPMDFMPSVITSKISQRINAALFSIYVNQRLPDNQGKFLRLLTGLPLSIIRNPKNRIKVWKHAEKAMVKQSSGNTAVELVTGLKAMFRPLEADWFSDMKYVTFEDTLMPVPKGYDSYLKLIFGNYMEMPPESERVAKHHTSMIDTEVPYAKYKGKYYLVRK